MILINDRLCDAVTALESKEKSILEGEMVKNMQDMIIKNKKIAQDTINKAFKLYSAEIEKKRSDLLGELDTVYSNLNNKIGKDLDLPADTRQAVNIWKNE